MDIVNKEMEIEMEIEQDLEISHYSEELELQSSDGSKISFGKAFINYFKSLLGISILAIPYVANQTGYIYACILLTMVFVLALRTNFLLLEVADHSQAQSFGEITYRILGRKASQFADLCIVTNQTFICIAYVIFFTKFFQQMFVVLGIDVSSVYYLLVSLAFILPIVSVSNIQIFSKTSGLGLIFGVFVILSSFFYEGKELYDGNTAINSSEFITFRQTFLFISVAIGSMEGGLTILPCRAAMQKQNEAKYVLATAFSIYYFCFIVAIYLNVLCYGNQLDQLYLFNLPQSTFTYTLTLLYTLNILLTYPIQIFPAHIIIDHLMGKMTKAKIMLFRLTLTMFIYICAYLIPNLTPLLGLLGAFFGTVVQFIYPVLLHWVYFKQQSLFTKLTYIGLISFSLVSLVIGTYESGKNLMISMK